MIQLTSEHTLLFMVLAIIGAIAISMFVTKIIIANIRYIKFLRAKNRKFQALMKAKKDLQESGDHHDWETIPFGTEEVLVCMKTGWCPSKNGFIPMEYIKEWERRKKLDEEYQTYRKGKVEALAEDYEMPYEHMEELIEKIFAIKQNFHTGKMKDAIDEMKKIVEKK